MNRKEKSISKNSIYYMVYVALDVIFPFLSGMYVARILLPEVVGKVSYAQNIAQYFVILAFLGIPTYGLREISKVRYEQDKLSKIYSELLIINFVSTLIFGTIYLIVIFSIPSLRENIWLYLIAGGSIALNILNNSWLYTGLEEFKYISIRNIIFKCLCFACLIIFIKGPEDYYIYAGITVFGTAGNYILNMAYAPHFVKFTVHGLSFKRHIKPIVQLVVVNLAIELYSLVDVTMLGAMSTKVNVAYYTYAQKINKILLQVINSFTAVVVPRLALYYHQNEQEKFNQLVSKDLEIIFAISIPIIVGLQIVSTDAISLLYGDAFSASASVLSMLSFLLIVSPTGYLLGSRILLVSNHESQMILCVGIGAAVNITGNAILIPQYAQIGAVAASIFSEIVVTVIYVFLGRKYYKLIGVTKDFLKIIIAAVIMGFVTYFIGQLFSPLLIKILIQVTVAAVVYFGILYIVKESIVYDYSNRLIKKIKKH